MNDIQYPLPPALRYSTLTLAAGTGGIVLWNFDMDSLKMSKFVFQATLFSCHVEDSCEVTWNIDTTEQNERVRASEWNITASLGSLENPLSLDPGIVIIKESKILCTNSDPIHEHRFFVYLYGGFITRENFKKLCRNQC